ncbi:YceI family protein [Chondromyces apiculatus]|nr:YceI family protein [Chondromyces apiculatus]
MTTTSTEFTAGAATKQTTAETRWAIDASHSAITFKVRHLMISNVRGSFQQVSGEVVYDPRHPEKARVSARIDVASITTNEEKRDAHLRSADFFDVETYPTITFVSKAFKPTGDGGELTGTLTIHGVEREVTLEVEELTSEGKDPWGNQRVGATAKTKILRSEFGMTFNAALETGGIMIGDEIAIQIEVELVKQA